jgi:hypothetical protein
VIRPIAWALLATLVAALPASAQGGPGGGRSSGYANPGAVIAAEIEYGRLAREKGEIAAIRATAADNAIVLAPARMLVHDMLKKPVSTPAPATLQPAEVWSSCDGSYAIARGAWQRGSAGGSFVTLWQRQPKGGYKWLLDLRSATPPPAASDMIAGNVAPCRGSVDRGAPRGRKQPIVQPGIDPASGHSDDGSLRWTATVDATGAKAGSGSFVALTSGGGGAATPGAEAREVMRVPLTPAG